MRTSQSGIELICEFEGYRAKAYKDFRFRHFHIVGGTCCNRCGRRDL